MTDKRFTFEVAEADAMGLMDDLMADRGFALVDRGPYAVSLQFLDAPSPHAVNLAVRFGDGRLDLELYMDDAAAIRTRELILRYANARGIALPVAT